MEQTHVTDVYNEIASHFDKTRAYTWKWIVDFLESTELNSNILDIGCGSGRNMQFESRKFTGIDTSISFVEICRKKDKESYVMDMCELDFPNKSFDNMICIASFHHLATAERRIKALREMKRVSRGKILLSVWSIEQPKKTRVTFDNYGDTIVPWVNGEDKYDRYYYIFEQHELFKLFREADLNVVSHVWDCGNEVFVLE